MDRKLTLKLNSEVIERAKVYAKEHSISLSKLIESYLNAITSSNSEKEQISPLVKELSGVISPETKDVKRDYGDHLEKKYK